MSENHRMEKYLGSFCGGVISDKVEIFKIEFDPFTCFCIHLMLKKKKNGLTIHPKHNQQDKKVALCQWTFPKQVLNLRCKTSFSPFLAMTVITQTLLMFLWLHRLQHPSLSVRLFSHSALEIQALLKLWASRGKSPADTGLKPPVYCDKVRDLSGGH